LDHTKYRSHFAFQLREFKIDGARSRMKYDVDRRLQQRKLTADGFPHASLDAIATDGVPHHFAYGQPDASAFRIGATQRTPVCSHEGARQEEVAHLLTELLAAAGIYALIVGMLAQPASGGNHKDPSAVQVTVMQLTGSLP
jgi:hypothetical protein